MIGDLVLTEHHTFGRQTAPHPVSLGSYGTDTHEIRRIVKDGVVAREGKTATGRGGAPPYPIGYAAIVPKAAECQNLFVTPFALFSSQPRPAKARRRRQPWRAASDRWNRAENGTGTGHP
jgi:hypothetical protein